jgi:DNA-binding MarR family transcriptional regulator
LDKLDLIRDVLGASQVFSSAVSELLEGTLEEVAGPSLALSQLKLLMLIARPAQRLKVTDIADFLGVTNAAASRAIDRLVQRGLVDRTISQEDRRAVDLSLTPRSQALLARFNEARNTKLLTLLGEYPTERLAQAVRLFDELSAMLTDPPTDAERCLRCGAHFRQGCVIQTVFGRECTFARDFAAQPASRPSERAG